jgi:hypothetical protein
MRMISKAFGGEETIPKKYTCEGANVNPPLTMLDVPPNAKSLALICDDPDAPVGTFVHWVVWNVNPVTREIKEGAKDIGMEGITDFRTIGYGGPCPPRGHGPHRYFFKLYALDSTIALKPGSSKKDLEKAMEGHILAKAELMGTYERR